MVKMQVCRQCYHFHSIDVNIGGCFWQPIFYKYSELAKKCDYFFPKRLKRKVKRVADSFILTKNKMPLDMSKENREFMNYVKHLRKGIIEIGNRYYVLETDYERATC